MSFIKINPFIRYAKMHSYLKFSKLNSVCYDCRLFYIGHGNGSIIINGKSYMLSGNETIFLPPKTRYRFVFDNVKQVSIFVLNFDLVDSFSNYKKSLTTPTEDNFDESLTLNYPLIEEFSSPIVLKNAFSTRRYIEKCIDLFLQKTPYYLEESSSRVKLALLEILRENKNSEYPLIQKVIDYIKENYFQIDLNNQTIADNFNYHPYHLNRIVKSYTQKTLHGFLLDYRIQMAKDLLVTTKLSVTQISEKVGFVSYTYFIKLFRERTGKSPLKYRNDHERIGL